MERSIAWWADFLGRIPESVVFDPLRWWIAGGKTYATNREILIEIGAEIPMCAGNKPQCNPEHILSAGPMRAIPLPPVVEERAEVCPDCQGIKKTAGEPCEYCDGGRCRCDCGHEHECGCCHGTGIDPDWPETECEHCAGKGRAATMDYPLALAKTPTGCLYLNARYVGLLLELGATEVAWDGGPHKRVMAVGDGWRAAVMTME